MSDKKTILLVEDEALIALSQKKSLQKYDYHVITASSGEKAVQLAYRTPGIDLILMDINLGRNMDGTEAAREILKDHDIPIVFLSSHTERDMVERTEQITSYGYVVKDSGITVLDASIKMALKLHDAYRGLENKDKLLKKSEEQYRNIFTKMVDGFAVHEIVQDGAGKPVDYRFLAVNPAFEQLTGLNGGELIGKTVREVLPDIEPVWIERYGEVALKGAQLHFEQYSGALKRYYEVTAYRPAPLQFACIFMDITERKRTEAELRESEGRFRAIASSTPDHVIVQDRNLRYTLVVNPQLGLTEEDMLGKRDYDFLTKEEADALIEAKKRVMDTGRPLRMETSLISKTGEKECFDGTYVPNYGPDGEIDGLIGYFRNVTGLKQAERALQESEANLLEAQRVAALGSWSYDAETGSVRWSDELYKIFDVDKEDFGGTYESFSSRVRPEDRDRVLETNRRALELGEPFDIEYRILTRSGGLKHIREIGYAKREGSGNVYGLFGTAQDITARKLAEEGLRASLREKELLLKEIHHRVKNNFAIVSSLLKLQAATVCDERSREVLGDCTRRIDTMAKIHTRIYQSENLSHINCNAYVNELVDDLLRSIRTNEGARMAVDVDKEIFLNIDTAIPVSLLLNELVTNSLKHAFPDGSEGAEILIALKRKNDAFVLTVSDNGIGFPEDLDFMNTDSLGMQLIVALVEQLEGTMKLDRHKGTGFTIDFGAGRNP